MLKWEDIEGGKRAEGLGGHYEVRPDNAIGDWDARFYRSGAHHAERLSLYRRGAEAEREACAEAVKAVFEHYINTRDAAPQRRAVERAYRALEARGKEDA